MTIHESQTSSRSNVETGVPGFDEILGGGLVSGGVYLLEGMAGAGKTILSSQIGFHRVSRGEKVLYMTLIAESHDKLLAHLKGLAFFDEKAVAQQMLFISGYHELMQDGLDGFLRLIASSIYDYRPSLMIIDGFRSAREFSETELALSKFIHELNALVAAMNCTTLLLAPLSGNEPHPEHTLVDGQIELNRHGDGMRRAREIEVHKMRARNHLMGRHFFRIAESGLLMFPRLEAQCAAQPGPVDLKARLGFGLPHLDSLLGGGFAQGSTTTLMGPSGAGKTLLGLQFLAAGVARDERCVYLGFYEGPQRLIGKAEAVSIALTDAYDDGRLVIQWQPAIELAVDELAATALATVRKIGASRIVIDGMEGFRDSALRTERFGLFLNALLHQLREAAVTTLVTEELPLYADPGHARGVRVSALTENLVLLRYAETESGLRRMISVVKQRESAHETSLRELVISSQGLDVAECALSPASVYSSPGLSATLQPRRMT
ncbi:ATPase domain-containing protein [Paraburkholderia terricola]|uniref:non-specific serine/threonine protein kinase n=1 Tax=Paraburkholderia terricola TaxID=169427 RepID=A0A1M6NGL5_9BURK|nr:MULTISPECIES: ATPase domain-containing protein [Paraburkholderia]ORC52337.1 serine/threonine protein kinase [Burkholderia sp. A27]SDO14407.1 circadian clock protein KaiC [Paraburkholderia sediminicola]SHJ94753.1 circadian clock protein KaiC [Paraburkholderia terricola]